MNDLINNPFWVRQRKMDELMWSIQFETLRSFYRSYFIHHADDDFGNLIHLSESSKINRNRFVFNLC